MWLISDVKMLGLPAAQTDRAHFSYTLQVQVKGLIEPSIPAIDMEPEFRVQPEIPSKPLLIIMEGVQCFIA